MGGLRKSAVTIYGFGRVALKGGGPHAELLRRTVHWLMKEPELDERALKIQVNGSVIRIRSRDAQVDSMALSMTTPDGAREDILLERNEGGFLEASVQAEQLGIYAFSDAEGQKRFVIIGEQNPPELRDVLTTADKLKPLSHATRGGVLWLDDVAKPSVRFARASITLCRFRLDCLSRQPFFFRHIGGKHVLIAALGVACFAWLIACSDMVARGAQHLISFLFLAVLSLAIFPVSLRCKLLFQNSILHRVQKLIPVDRFFENGF